MTGKRRRSRGGSSTPAPRHAESNVNVLNYQVSAIRREGPLPDPDTLARYEQLIPGTGERIISAFERQAAHRQELEREILQAQISDLRAYRREERFGQVFAFLIGVIAIVAGAYTATAGAELAGGFIGTGGVVGLVTVFIKGRSTGAAGPSPPASPTPPAGGGPPGPPQS